MRMASLITSLRLFSALRMASRRAGAELRMPQSMVEFHTKTGGQYFDEIWVLTHLCAQILVTSFEIQDIKKVIEEKEVM